MLRSALERYVGTPPVESDPAYTYRIESHTPKVSVRDWRFSVADEVDMYIVQMTSQRWRPEDKYRMRGVETADWHHTMSVYVPKRAQGRTGLMFVMGQSTPDAKARVPAMKGIDEIMMKVAAFTRCVVFWQGQVPNQGIEFADERGLKTRYETEFFAYTLSRFMDAYEREPDNPEHASMVLSVPMVKSVVRAMDTAQDLFRGNYFPEYKNTLPFLVEDFILVGASKRGQTALLTAAVDTRVKCVVSMVNDNINVPHQLKHMTAGCGYLPDVWYGFEAESMTCRMDTQAFAASAMAWNPASFADRLRLPKFIMNATGCEYFTPDGAQFYHDAFPEGMYYNYVPNASHRLVGMSLYDEGIEAVASVMSFCAMVLADKPLPRFNWRFLDDGAIEVETETKPASVLMWEASNPDSRDFRINTVGASWTSTKLKPAPGTPNRYVARPAPPEKGWKAYFVQLQFKNPLSSRIPLMLTTTIRVVGASTDYPVFESRVLRVGGGRLPVGVLRGTPEEMGLAHGRLLKEEIHRFIPAFLEEFREKSPHLSDDDLDASWRASMENLARCRKTTRLDDELSAVAQGAGIDAGLLRRANAAFALMALPGSAVAATRSAAAKSAGSPRTKRMPTGVMGCCWDWPLAMQASAHRCVLLYIPSFGLGFPHAVLTFPGLVTAVTGINICGLMLAGSSEGNDAPLGAQMPGAYLLREMLYDANNLRNAHRMVGECPLSSGQTIVAADGRHSFQVDKMEGGEPGNDCGGNACRRECAARTGFEPDGLSDVVCHCARGYAPDACAELVAALKEHHGGIDAGVLHGVNRMNAPVGAQVLRMVCSADPGLTVWVGPEDADGGAPLRVNLQEFLP